MRSERKSHLLGCADLIRRIFALHRLDVHVYSDEQLVDAMLLVCPDLNAFWLSPEHLRLTIQHLQSGLHS